MDKFGDHRHCDMGDLIVLIDHVTSRVHVFKGLGNFVSGSLFVINDSQKLFFAAFWPRCWGLGP